MSAQFRPTRWFQDAAAGTYINDATVTATIKTKSGSTVAGPIAMSYVAASNGLYRGTIADDLAVTLGVSYVAEITADGGAGLKGAWSFPFTVVSRIT